MNKNTENKLNKLRRLTNRNETSRYLVWPLAAFDYFLHIISPFRQEYTAARRNDHVGQASLMFVVQVSAYMYLQTMVKVVFKSRCFIMFAPSPKNATRPVVKTGLNVELFPVVGGDYVLFL